MDIPEMIELLHNEIAFSKRTIERSTSDYQVDVSYAYGTIVVFDRLITELEKLNAKNPIHL